jgi:para-aminobenzoate synthetase component 1
MRNYKVLNNINQSRIFKNLLEISENESYFALLNSVDFTKKEDKQNNRNFNFIAAWGVEDMIEGTDKNGFYAFEKFYKKKKDWLFGYFGYDLKNEVEHLHSNNPDYLNFPDLCFFQPAFLVIAENADVTFYYPEHKENTDEIYALIELLEKDNEDSKQKLGNKQKFDIKSRFSREEYVETVQKLKEHIKRGDIYEINFCQEFYAKAKIDPQDTYLKLNSLSPTPFSAFFKLNQYYLMSASPERFMKKKGARIISQPMKGTIGRGSTKEEDESLKQKLASDVKERAENVMIVDLVRNDLSRTAKKGSVEVEELCGIYTFPQVHQMISTVVAEIEEKDTVSCIKNAFPMGSMTGAPKVKSMELIEKYERSRRGLYSGSVGYFSPAGDFDLNVVIRSMFYNEKNMYLSYSVGGAITYLSDPQKEYEECLLKAKAMKQVLED